MQTYKSKAQIQSEFNQLDENHWVKQIKIKFENNLHKLNLSIDKLNEYSYKLALIQLLSFMKGKPITTVQEAQIIGCSQALVAKLHQQLTKAQLLQVLSNPKFKKTSREMRYVLRILWTRLEQLKVLNLINLNKLIKAISQYVMVKRIINSKPITDGLTEL